jgi:hypothetical protein
MKKKSNKTSGAAKKANPKTAAALRDLPTRKNPRGGADSRGEKKEK